MLPDSLKVLALSILLLLTAWWWTGPSSDELIHYSASCTPGGPTILPITLSVRLDHFAEDFKKYQAARAGCEILPLSRTVYKLNKPKGEVYYKLLDQTHRLVDCSIFSRTDWTCSYPDNSGKVVVIDGLRAIHTDDVSLPGGVNFSLRRWQWWAATLYWWVGRPRGAWLIPEQHAAL